MIRAVVFDLDGTLLKQGIDFSLLRRELGAPRGDDIIEFLRSLPPGERQKARDVIARHEEVAAVNSELNDGAKEVMEFIASISLPHAVFTRNSRLSLDRAVERHGLKLDGVCCRDEAAPKPSPEPLRKIASELGIPPSSILAVGDYAYDTESAIEAGAVAVFLTNGEKPRRETRAHFVVDELMELIPLLTGLRNGSILPGPPHTLET
ncbi:MAG: HAD family hydrolase [Planctomycetota bacterium]|jgi:HAD superfamily hydrolase (TIGR01549 family)